MDRHKNTKTWRKSPARTTCDLPAAYEHSLEGRWLSLRTASKTLQFQLEGGANSFGRLRALPTPRRRVRPRDLPRRLEPQNSMRGVPQPSRRQAKDGLTKVPGGSRASALRAAKMRSGRPARLCGLRNGIAAKFRSAVQHARLAAHQQVLNAAQVQFRKDFEYRVRGQASHLFAGKTPKAARPHGNMTCVGEWRKIDAPSSENDRADMNICQVVRGKFSRFFPNRTARDFRKSCGGERFRRGKQFFGPARTFWPGSPLSAFP
jgi:hypothetical protein